MIRSIFLPVYFMLLGIILPQTIKEKVEQLKSNPLIDVKEVKPDIYKISDKLTGKFRIKNLTDVDISKKDIEKINVKKLTIDINTFDFNAYNDMYHEWSKVPLSAWKSLKAADANGNGKAEFYGNYLLWPERWYSTSRIYELGDDSTFNFIYEYQLDSVIYPYDIGDLDGDGNLDIVTENFQHQIHVYTQENSSAYLNSSKFMYGFWNRQMQTNDVTFYDFDGDGTLEIVYYLFAGGDGEPWEYSNHIAKYNAAINNYEMIYYHQPPDWTWGLSVGDYDDDGLGNMAAGDSYGTVYMYEYDGEGGYEMNTIDTLDVSNAFITTYSPDLDGNGKSELWIGGDSYGSITGGFTRIYMFEADSNNYYKVKFEIEILGLFSWSAGNMWTDDIDLDGTDDVLLSVDAGVFVFKCIGESDYELLLAIPNPGPFDGGYLWPDGANSYDLDSDGRPEIFISGDLEDGNNFSRSQAKIYKLDFFTGVEEESKGLADNYQLNQNYPNPFNPETKISYVVPKESFVNISVYNILGEKITDLVNKEQTRGSYTITFNGNNLPSGIYLIRMTAGASKRSATGFSKTIKAILMK